KVAAALFARAEGDFRPVGRDGPFVGRLDRRAGDAEVDVVPIDVRRGRTGRRWPLERQHGHRHRAAATADEGQFLAGVAPGYVAVKGRVTGDVPRLLLAVRGDDVKLARIRTVDSGVHDPLAVGRPFIVKDLHIGDEHLGVAAIGLHGPKLAGPNESDPLAVG